MDKQELMEYIENEISNCKKAVRGTVNMLEIHRLVGLQIAYQNVLKKLEEVEVIVIPTNSKEFLEQKEEMLTYEFYCPFCDRKLSDETDEPCSDCRKTLKNTKMGGNKQ